MRWLTLPVWMAFALTVLALSPLLAVLARLARRVATRREPVAIARLLCVYVTRELAVMAAAVRLWVTSGFGARLRDDAYAERHYLLFRDFLADLVGTAMRGLRLRLDVDVEPAAAAALADPGRPLLVFSRHAGAGDSILLVHLLLGRFDRRPRIVMKETLAIDPVFGLIGRRLPMALLEAGDDGASDDIRDLARGLDGRAALLLFPEGGNFTEQRRAGAIRSLRRRGRGERAGRAEKLEHMISPRLGGVLAALDGAPDADVVFAAHTGLGRAAKGVQILRELPHDGTVRVRLWLAPAAERPTGEKAQAGWLDAWWARLDDWVDAEGAEG